MQINKIQATGFEGKKRFLTPEMTKNVNYLMDKMYDRTKYSTDGYYFSTTIFKELSSKKGNVKFQDGRIYTGSKLPQKDMECNALFTIGKTELVIDSKTGEIIDYYKPLFKTWSKIMKQIDEYLKFFKENFDNQEFVRQRRLSMSGFTEKGWEKIKQIEGLVHG